MLQCVVQYTNHTVLLVRIDHNDGSLCLKAVFERDYCILSCKSFKFPVRCQRYPKSQYRRNLNPPIDVVILKHKRNASFSISSSDIRYNKPSDIYEFLEDDTASI